jgi:hypothetical protein
LRPGIPQTNSYWKHRPSSLSLGCDFFDRFVFSAYPTSCISSFQPPDEAVILSEALRRSIANRELYGAESKDPGDASWQMLLRAFRPQTTPEDKKSHRPRPERPVPACRGSGGEGSAVRHSDAPHLPFCTFSFVNSGKPGTPYPEFQTRGNSSIQEPQTTIPLPLFLNLHQFCTSAASPVLAQRTKLKLSHG